MNTCTGKSSTDGDGKKFFAERNPSTEELMREALNAITLAMKETRDRATAESYKDVISKLERVLPAVGNDGLVWPHTFDAQAWAIQFNKRFPTVSVDDALGWFANAIMRGHDTALQKREKEEAAGYLEFIKHVGLTASQRRDILDIADGASMAPRWGTYSRGTHMIVERLYRLAKS